MKRLFTVFLMCFMVNVSRASFYITDGQGTTYSSGIVDDMGSWHASGIFTADSMYGSSSPHYSEYGIVGWSSGYACYMRYYGSGILRYGWDGMRNDYIRETRGIWDGSMFYPYGVLGQYTYASGRGIVDAMGIYEYTGILDGNGYRTSNGIFDGTTRYPNGIFDGTYCNSSGIWDGMQSFSRGIFDGNTYHTNGVLGVLGVANWFGLTYAHFTAGGTLRASNIGTLTSTSNLVAEVLKSGVRVDNVTGTLSTVSGAASGPSTLVVEGAARAVEASGALRVIQ